ncbi:RNA chaperone Hfq, partial [Leclercia adecarboxylata]|jgi:host factor-I protein|nr:RNA chaperone Hfq [Leclercia adecarboxylata]
VYKHAISTVVPGRPVRLPTAGDAEQSESGND